MTNNITKLSKFGKPEGREGRELAEEMNTGHAEVTEWAFGLLEILDDAVVLDIGCGGGAAVEWLASRAPYGAVIGIDHSEASVEVAKERNSELIRKGRVEIRNSSVSDLPFPDGMFNLVTAVETHYFWPDLPWDLAEVLRVMKPGGLLAVICTAYRGSKYEERNLEWVEKYGMTYLSIDELRNLLYSTGFTSIESSEDYEKGWLSLTAKKPSLE